MNKANILVVVMLGWLAASCGGQTASPETGERVGSTTIGSGGAGSSVAGSGSAGGMGGIAKPDGQSGAGGGDAVAGGADMDGGAMSDAKDGNSEEATNRDATGDASPTDAIAEEWRRCSLRCSGNVLEEYCLFPGGETLMVVATCSYACAAGMCLTCFPGSHRCDHDTSQICDARGMWVDIAQCSSGCADAGLCIGDAGQER